jgi:hypothetical protein
MHHELLLKALRLIFYLTRFETLTPVPAEEILDDADPEDYDAEDIALVGYLRRKVWKIFGKSYWMLVEDAHEFQGWEKVYEAYLPVAAQVSRLPARDRGELLDLLIREVEGQPSSSTDGTDEDSPLVRMNDLAEPLGFSPLDVLDRCHALHMRSLEFDLDEVLEAEEDQDLEVELMLGLREKDEDESETQ